MRRWLVLCLAVSLAGAACSGVTAQNKADYERVTETIDAIELPPGSSDETREGQPGAEGTYGRSLEYKRRATLPADVSLGESFRFVLESAQSQGWTVLRLSCDPHVASIAAPDGDFGTAVGVRGSGDTSFVSFGMAGGPSPLYNNSGALTGEVDWECLDG